MSGSGIADDPRIHAAHFVTTWAADGTRVVIRRCACMNDACTAGDEGPGGDHS